MKKLIIVLIVAFSFSFMAGANNAVTNNIVTKIEKNVTSNKMKLEESVDKKKKISMIYYVECLNGNTYYIAANSDEQACEIASNLCK
jgi:hypothetical protein